MADERELFSQFKPTWWSFVHDRAWERTCRVLHIDFWTVIFATLVLVVVALVSFLFLTADDVLANVGLSVIVGASSAVIVACWYAVTAVLAIREVYYEQQANIADLETTLAKQPRIVSAVLEAAGVGAFSGVGEAISVPPGHLTITGHAPSVVIAAPSLADRLIQFRIDGVKLRNEQVDATALDAWRGRVDKWKSEVVDTVKGQVNLADVARFITLDRVPVMDFSWACDKKHTKALRELSQRIQILLEIMAKL